MEKFVIEGGKRLEGSIRVSGAKNSALELMAASTMGRGPSVIENVPQIADVETMIELLKYMGYEVSFSNGVLRIIPGKQIKLEAPYHLVQKMRASTSVLGALLARHHRARVAMPGGCNIGTRQIDLHIEGLSRMGARIGVSHGFMEASTDGLRGTRIYLDYPSVGATENLMMAGTLADGKTIIENAAEEPEIVDLAEFLKKMGAHISGDGTSTIVVEGVDFLEGAEHTVIADRIEAGTFLIAGAVTGGKVKVRGINPVHLDIVIQAMKACGCNFEIEDDSVSVSSDGEFTATEISTLPYPGFPTDLQPQFQVLLSIADGISFVTENVFDNRFMVSDELNRLGANIKARKHYAVIRGVKKLSGAPVRATDLRAGAALVIAGLMAEGLTEVYDIYHIDRGYERFSEKLSGLGANIKRVSVDTPDSNKWE
ncbi:MAG: UDP-N-acetylglucosamine 1-carboxyvinyltransferase [Actinomycetota bacterium]|nr:UDP-N-acetylglucosamine 1-carboxyvinyltransferase [Actinomycetota bacterium]